MWQRPSRREDFEVGIICALPLEYDAVILLFDELWDKEGDKFGRAAGDPNLYTTGRIGQHDVVLALLPQMGKASAAAAAASMRSSYAALRLMILPGICGGVPYDGQAEILLGDVVISKKIIQHDFGRKYPDRFIRKETIEDNLSRPDKNVSTLLAIFNTDSGKDRLQERTGHFLEQLQEKAKRYRAKYKYPGIDEDKLFEPSYRHKHRNLATCICKDCYGRIDPVCSEALASSCEKLGCDERYLVARRRIGQQKEDMVQKPAIHIGVVASGDTVMKSGEDRDKIAKEEGVIAFEMEGAGVWDEIPCLAVKGVCDYADCHKNKAWQNFAAATAASALKAILERYIGTDAGRARLVEEKSKCHILLPFGRNQNFVGREIILSALLERILPSVNREDCQKTAIEGLGGVGKTQIALEAAYLVHGTDPDCSIFWVPAVDLASIENAYRDIGKQLNIDGIDDDHADIKQLVKNALSKESSGSWLLVVDNADDVELLFGAAGLSTNLPFSRKGSILFTTRNHEAALRLDIPAVGIFCVEEMNSSEALSLLQIDLRKSQTSDKEGTKRLLGFLANLPLAIRQASAYMATKYISAPEYLELCVSEHDDMIELLSRDFEDRYRYKEIQNPVAATWLVSFKQILHQNPLAADYLKFMSVLAEKAIPKSLLPTARKLEVVEAIGILKSFAFIAQREGEDAFDMHRLVRLAMRNWLKKEGELGKCITSAINRLDEAFPLPNYENGDLWIKYLPHAQAVLEFPENLTERGANLCANAANGNNLLGRHHEAEQMHRKAVEFREKALGTEHPDTHISMNDLSLVLSNLGKYHEAEQLHRQVVDSRMKLHGLEHPATFISMNNLADVLSHQGRYEEAEQMHKHVLELRKKELGEEHPDTLGSMNNLANAVFRLGKYQEAAQRHQQVLGLSEKVLGKEHPDTLNGMNNLAIVLSELGKYEDSVQIRRHVLERREKLFGLEHPDTLSCKNDLATLLCQMTKYQEAEQMLLEVLEARLRLFGVEHPQTLTSMNSLAGVLSNIGKYQDAEQMHQQVLKLRKKMLGTNHPDTLFSMNNVAEILSSLGKYQEAEQMHQQVLKLREEMLGKEHPDTISSMSNLAHAFAILGKYRDAEQIYLHLPGLSRRVNGMAHPTTLTIMNNHAHLLFNISKYHEAEQLGQQVLELSIKVLGKEHQSTLYTMNNLALVLSALGKHQDAEQMQRHVFKLLEKRLGKEHPDTILSTSNLAYALSKQGKYEEAEQIYRHALEVLEKVLGKDHPQTRNSRSSLIDCLNEMKGRQP